jgi:hypothetical protein
MPSILLIKKNGDLVSKNIKEFDFSDIYKYCGYKNDNNFSMVHKYSFESKNENYSIYGKNNGRANNENKYELPPPIDTTLFFGTLCIVKTDNNNNVISLEPETWNKTYEYLFGGFEDIGEEDSDETRSVDSEIFSDDEYTKEGYLKDDFIVEDDELEEEEYEDYE